MWTDWSLIWLTASNLLIHRCIVTNCQIEYTISVILPNLTVNSYLKRSDWSSYLLKNGHIHVHYHWFRDTIVWYRDLLYLDFYIYYEANLKTFSPQALVTEGHSIWVSNSYYTWDRFSLIACWSLHVWLLWLIPIAPVPWDVDTHELSYVSMLVTYDRNKCIHKSYHTSCSLYHSIHHGRTTHIPSNRTWSR